MRSGRRLTTVASTCLVFFTLLGAGCLTTPPLTSEWPAPAEPEVLLQPGDQLQIRFPYWEELDVEQSVRPDGKIALHLAGDVVVAGKSPEQVRAELLELYKDKIKDPEVTVIVKSFDSQRFYVGGEVMRPGIYPLVPPTTLLSALMTAGGPDKRSAQLRNVVVIRQKDGRQYAQAIDVRKMIAEPESQPFYLAANDVVFVPRTPIDKVDQFVDKYINQIIPRNVYMTFTKDVNNPTFSSDTLNTTFQITR